MIRVKQAIRPFVFLLLGTLLAIAGLAKVNDPSLVSDFLVQVLSLRISEIGRAIGFAEIGLALWLMSGAGQRWAAFTTAIAFTAFAVTHLYASNSGIESNCGCLGRGNWTARVPTWGWVVGNSTFALMACAVSTTAGRQREIEADSRAHNDTIPSGESGSES